MPKKTVEEELNDFLDQWHAEDMIELFEEIIPLIVAYQISTNEEGELKLPEDFHSDKKGVMIAKTAYHMVRIAERFAGKLVGLKVQFKGLPKRMEEVK